MKEKDTERGEKREEEKREMEMDYVTAVNTHVDRKELMCCL